MATLNITNIPAPRVPFIDERTGLMAREWYRFFLNLFVLTGSGSNPTSLDELQIGPPNQPDLAELLIQINQNIAPQYEDQSGDFLATLDTAQLMSMMARFENLEAAIQGAYLNPPSVPTDGVYVPYNNATTNVDLNNKHIVNVAHIGVGTSSTPDTLILAVGDNGSLSRVVMRGYSASTASSAMRVSKYRGTVTAPQVPQSGDSLGRYEFAGYTTTSADGSAGAYWEGVTTETWGATANGTKVLLKVTPNTTTTPVTAVTIDQDKTVAFADTTDATSTTAAALITAGGLAVAKKVYTGDNVVPAAAKGVNFTGNTPAAGMTSQLMNWYEEGTWTPVMTFSTNGDLAVTYSAQAGFYERIGSMVTAHFRVVASAFTYTTATGTFQITGLPFTSNATTNFIGVGPVYINNVLMTAVSATATYPTARVTNGTSIINIIICGNNSAAATANQASMPSGNLVGFTGLVTYRV